LKRERAVKEAAAQQQAADLGVQLTKAKAAAAVKSAYMVALARRLSLRSTDAFREPHRRAIGVKQRQRGG
jgi:hypothetical protein